MVSIAFNSVCARRQPTRTEDRVIARNALSILDSRSSILNLRSSMAMRMRMLLVMQPEQVLAIVVSVRSPDDRVDVLPIHLPRVGSEAAQAHRQLVIEFDQDHRALDAVIEDVV